MITAGIVDARSPYAEAVLRTASALNIRYYRWGGFPLDAGKSIPQQIEEDKLRVRALAALNDEFGECAMYHTHSGTGVLGASIWDLYLLLKDFNQSGSPSTSTSRTPPSKAGSGDGSTAPA